MNRILKFPGRHWRGETSMMFAVLFTVPVVGFLAQGGVMMMAGLLPKGDNLNQFIVFTLAHTILYLCSPALALWQATGTWRAARRHRRERGQKALAYIVQGMAALFLLGNAAYAVLVCLASGHVLSTAQTREANISLTKSGHILHLDGEIGFTAASAVKEMLGQNQDVQIIQLNSPGGVEAGGLALYDVLRDGELTTYILNECSGACAIAFAGGARRLAGDKALMKFFRPEQDRHEDVTGRLREAGISPMLLEQIDALPVGKALQVEAPAFFRFGLTTQVLPEDP